MKVLITKEPNVIKEELTKNISQNPRFEAAFNFISKYIVNAVTEETLADLLGYVALYANQPKKLEFPTWIWFIPNKKIRNRIRSIIYDWRKLRIQKQSTESQKSNKELFETLVDNTREIAYIITEDEHFCASFQDFYLINYMALSKEQIAKIKEGSKETNEKKTN